MAIQSIELVELAERLLEESSEVAWRGAISRAYYATYLRAVDWEREQGVLGANIGPSGGLHQQLINRLEHPSSSLPLAIRTKAQNIGAQLKIQRRRRIRADYRPRADVSFKEASAQVRQARRVLEQHCAPPSQHRRA